MKNVRGSLQSVGQLLQGNTSIQQLAIGSLAGFATGYLTMKVGRKVAFLVGGGIIVFQVCQSYGVTKMSWQDAKNKTKSISQRLEGTTTCWKDKAKAYAAANTCFAASFVGGFLIGASCNKH